MRVLEYLAARSGAPILLPALAAEVTGDTKALNHGTVTSTLVLRALALRAELPRPDSAAARRELWEISDVDRTTWPAACSCSTCRRPAEG